jgi:phytol kinase
MLLALFLSLLGIFLLLCVTELLWRKKKLHIETSRKIVHIGTGILIAFWPLYLKWEIIQALSILLLVVVFVSYKLHIFRSIHEINRLTIGEILYPVGIGVCAFLEPAPWVFTAAVLHLTLADGFAAIAGAHWGKTTRYTLITHGKSLVGSAVFFITSFLIFFSATFFVSEQNLPHSYGLFALAALLLTAVENISWYGSDDITVPVSVIVILTLLPS